MLDIQFIRAHPAIVKEAVKNKKINLDVDKLLQCDAERRDLILRLDNVRQRRNQIADTLSQTTTDREQLVQEGKGLKTEMKGLEENLGRVEQEYQSLLYLTPTIPSSDTPIGQDATSNLEIRKWGEIPVFDFKARDHIELARLNNWIDFERGVKVSGFRGYFLKGQGALLSLDLLLSVFHKIVEKGYTPIIPPTLVKEFTLWGTGHFPFGIGDNYEITNTAEQETAETMQERLLLAGTAEVGIGAYYGDEVLKEEDLPFKLVGFSPCFRREVGSYGRDTHGIYRIHEFMKVEQFIICKNDYEESERLHQELLANAEEIVQGLKIPYRVIQLCTGDMGAGKYKMFDIECWMPSRKGYGETHSCSNLGEWQARRLNIRYKTKSGDTQYVHTLNNTAIASPRILIPLMELNQDKEGKIRIPALLSHLDSLEPPRY